MAEYPWKSWDTKDRLNLARERFVREMLEVAECNPFDDVSWEWRSGNSKFDCLPCIERHWRVYTTQQVLAILATEFCRPANDPAPQACPCRLVPQVQGDFEVRKPPRDEKCDHSWLLEIWGTQRRLLIAELWRWFEPWNPEDGEPEEGEDPLQIVRATETQIKSVPIKDHALQQLAEFEAAAAPMIAASRTLHRVIAADAVQAQFNQVREFIVACEIPAPRSWH